MKRAHDAVVQHRRPRTWRFDDFLAKASAGELNRMTITVKRDGFFFKSTVRLGTRVFFSKGVDRPIRITDTPKDILEAIALFLDTRYPEVDSCNVGYSKPVYEVYFEFVAVRKSSARDYLQGLFLKECLDASTGRLNEEDFDYFPVVFDALVNRRGMDPPYWKRLILLEEAFGRMACEQIFCAQDMLDTLLEAEGLILHEGSSEEHCWKVKLPKVPVRARVVAVANTIPGFQGFNLFLLAVPCREGWSVIHALDWTEIFVDYTRVEKGKCFVNPQSVKVVDGVVTCSSKSSLQPLVDAMFRAVSGVRMVPLTRFGRTKARLYTDGGPAADLVCGKSRSFSFDMKGAEFKCLTQPVPITVGCVELWKLQDDEIHLQPAMVLGLQGYGHEAYKQMSDFTTLELLREIAAQPELCPRKIYELVGMKTGPFLGLEAGILRNMSESHFRLD